MKPNVSATLLYQMKTALVKADFSVAIIELTLRSFPCAHRDWCYNKVQSWLSGSDGLTELTLWMLSVSWCQSWTEPAAKKFRGKVTCWRLQKLFLNSFCFNKCKQGFSYISAACFPAFGLLTYLEVVTVVLVFVLEYGGIWKASCIYMTDWSSRG